MTLLDEKTRQDIKSLLEDLAGPVELVVFTQEFECQFCRETRELIEEIATLSEMIDVEVLDFLENKDRAEELNIDKIPAIAILGAGKQSYGVRYYGIPSGYEFSSLLHDIKAVAAGPDAVPLDGDTLAFLDSLEQDIHLQVFVTPTCPYCPRAVVLAHAMAIASDRVSADMVEATEFPHLSVKYDVMGVPRTVINETEFVEGSVPEQMLLDAMRAASN
ncbi:MAG: thioredoxin family protein [Anaerolineae bacterium]|nr:thioredoxin family protein [Anaerolineae bacterium]